MKAKRIIIKGVVQGVGFRPFLYRLARSLNLSGVIMNSKEGVYAHIQGEEENLALFVKLIPEKCPANAFIRELIVDDAPPFDQEGLRIVKEEGEAEVSLDLLPDLAICADCRREFFDPENRRFKHPFIACTNCGPRYGMLVRLPYERENTTMASFTLCSECDREYRDPMDRRFHAEAIACPHCGPKLTLYSGKDWKELARETKAVELARELLLQGAILAVKGLSGFHLFCRADKPEVVARLRLRKKRPSKPLAVMFPDPEVLKGYCLVDEKDLSLLLSPQSPILLLKGRGLLPKEIAEGIDLVGALLPYTPLHLLLLDGLEIPVVATSGNLSGEPLVFEEEKARVKLSQVADYFLLHDRKILRGADDSVVKRVGDTYVMIRRARGYAPYPLMLPFTARGNLLALGAEEKSTFTLGLKDRLIVSPHIGDLSNPEASDYFLRLVEEYLSFYDVKNFECLLCDLHPHYQSTRLAKRLAKEWGVPLIQVQHHHAHLLSVLAEEGIVPEEEMIGVAWDGTGFGLDGSIWGGETLLIHGLTFKRIRSFRPFLLIGGESGIKDTRKSALSLLFEVYGERALELSHPVVRSFSERELAMLYKAWQGEGLIRFPITYSCGRLFDAVSALAGVSYRNTYEGESPMKLEALYNYRLKGAFPYRIKDDLYFDWEPLVREVVEGRYAPEEVATYFVNTLIDFLCQTVVELDKQRVIISGGVMVNAPLLRGILDRLEPRGIKVLRNRRYPPTDGGISLGQAYYGKLISIFSKTS